MRGLSLFLTALTSTWASSHALRLGRVTEGSEIQDIPGLGAPHTPMFAGYLDVDTTKHFYYMLQEKQANAAESPLVVWLNGGPGCSSLEGASRENGEFHISNDGSPYWNPYAWTQVANMLYIDSPVGVGFSYSDDPAKDYKPTDDSTANDLHEVLRAFFTAHPTYQGRDFYVTGESYAGVYIPMLGARLVADATLSPHFRGVAIGNGLLDDDDNAQTYLPFVFGHAMIGLELFNAADKACHGNFSSPRPEPACADAVEAALREIGPVNPYDIIGPCNGLGQQSGNTVVARGGKNPLKEGKQHRGEEEVRKESGSGLFRSANAALRRISLMNPLAAAAFGFGARGTVTVGGGAPCIASSGMESWFNSATVKKALHANPNVKWELCSDVIDYTRQYTTQRPNLAKINAAGKKILIYNGSSDSVCNVLGNMRTVHAVFGPKGISRKRAAWYVDSQVAGYTEHFDNGNVVTATVRAAGHMVPQYQPPRALAMITRYLNGTL